MFIVVLINIVADVSLHFLFAGDERRLRGGSS
jgi:hypothetical protein